LLCIEATANFALKYKKGRIRYREAESAFDQGYAKAIGMPIERIDFGEPLETVEDMFEDLQNVVEKSKGPELYICDSLDALSDRGEMARDMDKGSYGAEKAKLLSQLFRRLIRKMERKQVTCVIVSQVRDKIGVSFGRKTTRSGGKALDFYASQVAYLAHIGRLQRTIKGMKRATGIEVRAHMDKNKIALPFREAQFPVLFGYGVDDVTACLMYLKEAKLLKECGFVAEDITNSKLARELMSAPHDEAQKEIAYIHRRVQKHWYEVERKILPPRTKYGS